MQDRKQTQKRLKVCFAITKGVWGGASKYVYSLATHLPKENFDVVIICGHGTELPEKLESVGIRTYKIKTLKRDISLIAEIKSSWQLLKIIWVEHPDVLHLNSPKASGFGAVAGRLTGVKNIIQTIHGWTFNENRNYVNKILIAFFSWLTTLLCHRTIVIAQKEQNQALSMPFTKNKIILIHNGIKKVDFKEKVLARKELSALVRNSKFETDNSTAWIGTIAELHKNKGLEYAISAVSKITFPFIFIIIGEGEERKNLERLISKHNLQDKVFLPGSLENANKNLKAFDIFLSTSVKEGLPYTILEAGQAGLPVVASNVGGIPDIIENGVSGILTVKGKIGEITKSLEYLISNPDKQKEFGRKLQEKVLKDFSLEKMVEKTKALYNF